MKKLLATSIAVIALSACGETKTIIVEKAPDTTVRTTVTPSYGGSEQNFIDGIVSDFPAEVSNLGKTKILQMGRLVCQSIDEGATVADFANLAVESNVDGGFIGSLIREAVENFCPENQWFITSALNA